MARWAAVTLPEITEAEADEALRWAVRNASILDSVPIISPHFERPAHLEPLARILRRMHKAARGEGPPVLACISTPPQVGKTESVQHAIAWWLARNPEDFIGYISYGASIAESKSRRVRDLARRVGVDIRADSRAVDLWNTTAGGGLLARGRDGGITGQSALKAIVIDDPYRNRVEAESRYFRGRVLDDFRSTIWTRRHPTTSILVMHTRWHEDDLTGTLSTEGWERHVIRAIDDSGAPLWPESGRDLEYWEATRKGAGEYAWWSMYMGEPRPREGRLFAGTHFHDGLPHEMAVAIGVDLAYSSKTSADYSVAVALGYDRSRDTFYVLDVLREQIAAPEFAGKLKAWRTRWPGSRCHAYLGGTEKGVADFFAKAGVPLSVQSASVDKFTRAQPASAAWNAGRVLLPEGEAQWVEDFAGELLDFSGVRDAHDDQVDAFVAAFDAVSHAALSSVSYSSKRLKGTATTGAVEREKPATSYGAQRISPWGRGGKKGAW